MKYFAVTFWQDEIGVEENAVFWLDDENASEDEINDYVSAEYGDFCEAYAYLCDGYDPTKGAWGDGCLSEYAENYYEHCGFTVREIDEAEFKDALENGTTEI